MKSLLVSQIEANQGVDFAPIEKQIDETKSSVNGVANNVKENKESISNVTQKLKSMKKK